MNIVYVGPHRPGVEIAATGQFAPFGKTIEVEAELGARLLEQSVWADKVPAKQEPVKPAKEELKPGAARPAPQAEPADDKSPEEGDSA